MNDFQYNIFENARVRLSDEDQRDIAAGGGHATQAQANLLRKFEGVIANENGPTLTGAFVDHVRTQLDKTA